ncbi:MAG: deoxyribonuclease IV [Acidimicrobiia bacterium]|nr:MAG: deoxyribonuclease IV [Acidimicrobiia bacterium]
MTRRVGAHTPAADPLAEAAARGADLVQVFLSNPQSWKKPKPREDAQALRSSPVALYVHAPYLVNVVSENNRIRIPSRRILQDTCDAAAEVGAAGVVVHGGHVTDGDLSEAYGRWRRALELLDTEVPVLIENTASGEGAVARRVESIRRLWEEIGDLDVGFVLDTCHAWAGGEPLEEVVERLLEATGRIDLIHCNDSRDPFDSRRDRHANLGSGKIPSEVLAAVLRKVEAPVVVETPGGPAEQAADIAWVREALG